ncbi:MAG: Rieske (2Fe-2S) protein [Planctomycetes bacterium]|nr:Rieske (2Fe-2S) protein [Planctomycetota bacterium]
MSDQTNSTTEAAKTGEWVDLCAVADIPANGGKFVQLTKHYLAVFKLGDGVSVIDDTCPHAGGSLASGFVSDGCVHCPWHGWPFKIEDGVCPDNPGIKVKAYPARVVENRVQAQV